VAQAAQGLKGRVLSKKFVLPIKSWFFFFSLLENVANFQMKQQLPTIPYHEFHN
jgi:hypothetical protein